MGRRIAKEIQVEFMVKAQAGEPVSDLAEQYAVGTTSCGHKTIYGWLR